MRGIERAREMSGSAGRQSAHARAHALPPTRTHARTHARTANVAEESDGRLGHGEHGVVCCNTVPACVCVCVCVCMCMCVCVRARACAGARPHRPCTDSPTPPPIVIPFRSATCGCTSAFMCVRACACLCVFVEHVHRRLGEEGETEGGRAGTRHGTC